MLGEAAMKVKLERSGDDLVLPLADELIERYKLKEGDELDGDAFAAELGRSSYQPRAVDPDPKT